MLAPVSSPFSFEPNADPVESGERARRIADPGFGRVFTDHMAVVHYSDARGWHQPQVVARAPLSIDPACAVLHYAQEIFEGLKAYRQEDGGLSLFRPDMNAARFRSSARRLAMPELPETLFVASLEALIAADKEWMPPGPDASIYLRPFMIASETFLGVKPSGEYLYMVIAAASGSYWKGGTRPISLWVSHDFARAATGGTGAAKCGGNYAASLVAQADAIRRGCDQVVFLDAAERRWVEELGGMNIFFVQADGSLRTPPLTGTILPGVTRDSLIQLARDEGLTVREEPYAIDQWRADAKAGANAEAFACGTAAVVTPIGRVAGPDYDFQIGNGETGPVTARLLERLTAIQRGQTHDPHGWRHALRS
ncbi:MAG: branched-chain amino acid aminotransferase [Sphingomonas bacterium]|uniref:branched-chain amino acid aminotransferase n=1 Tax=Sphingomonas bacterium TaxID=1895847 RepID=UPI00262E9115|nr:branched-chain amino acid aminotransferase [Sphingomonas bacterium]MDB5696014.1 branched-chain amino acid aminotransferase [Sphingomonas bacterium]